MGQVLTHAIEQFPAPVYAAIEGYCMGGGLDLALCCHCRIASSHTVFGHRGAALGWITGWRGTQRLSRRIGKGRALEVLVAAEKISKPDGPAHRTYCCNRMRPSAGSFRTYRGATSLIGSCRYRPIQSDFDLQT
jgi:hypothetical protein